MRTRETIEKEQNYAIDTYGMIEIASAHQIALTLEVLLDIRDLLVDLKPKPKKV